MYVSHFPFVRDIEMVFTFSFVDFHVYIVKGLKQLCENFGRVPLVPGLNTLFLDLRFPCLFFRVDCMLVKYCTHCIL